jgi:hypothetical protein
MAPTPTSSSMKKAYAFVIAFNPQDKVAHTIHSRRA